MSKIECSMSADMVGAALRQLSPSLVFVARNHGDEAVIAAMMAVLISMLGLNEVKRYADVVAASCDDTPAAPIAKECDG